MGQQCCCPEHSVGQAVVFPGKRAMFTMHEGRRAALPGPGAPGTAGSSAARATSCRNQTVWAEVVQGRAEVW